MAAIFMPEGRGAGEKTGSGAGRNWLFSRADPGEGQTRRREGGACRSPLLPDASQERRMGASGGRGYRTSVIVARNPPLETMSSAPPSSLPIRCMSNISPFCR